MKVEWRAPVKRFLRDPHTTLLKLGLAVVLVIELYKFIRFVAMH
jgi:hypothetical protein